MATIVQELRRVRRTRRLGELEWFEVAYRVYLVALVGGGAVLWAVSSVHDLAVTPAQLADVSRLGPSALGVVAAAVLALGLRSGSDGGPVALEPGDVQYLLMAPVPRRAVMTRPVVQRLRATTFGGAVLGGIAGLLAADRLPGSPTAWAAGAGGAGAAIGAGFTAVAVVTHALRVPRAVATALAVVLVTTQIAAVAGWLPAGPTDTIGSLALWGMRQRPVDLIGVAVIAALAGAAVALADRLRTEPLVRRAGLVSQLHFAVTMQDLRTVVLLRRQLRGEHARSTPWLTLPRSMAGGATVAVWKRGWRSLLRYPSARVVRMAGLAIVGGVAAIAVADGTAPMIVVVGLVMHLLGLDAIEPLSQEIDHPDHTDATPRPRGWVLAHHLAAPAVAVVPFALLGAAVVAAVQPEHALAALALAIPVALGGVAGAVISVVRDAPDPLAAPVSTAVPPEFAGFTSTMRLLWPVAVSVLGVLPVLFAAKDPTAATALRASLGSLLLVAAVVWWVRRRDEWRQRWQGFLDEGRAATKPGGARTW
jgi:hypothetical protein